ncbi:MAG: hypothetical protein PHI58_02780 [Candidatus Omnitrophica bacterium]|nr:hypothetical protein [Candidatus Omnitrophota bacterium]
MMKILITLRRRKTHRYLINLFTKSLIAEVRKLIAARDFALAMELVYKEGLMEREVMEEEVPTIKTDLILSEYCANWDLTK